MKKNVVIKPHNKSSATASSEYLKNLSKHEHTLIPKDLNYTSEALRSFNCDWSIIDAYEGTLKRHAKEFIIQLPREVMSKDGAYDKKAIEKYLKEFVNDLSKETGMNKSKMIYEAQVHLDLEYDEIVNGKVKHHEINPHIHFLISERELSIEPNYQTYRRNTYIKNGGKQPVGNGELDKLMETLSPSEFEKELQKRDMSLIAKMGDIKKDKNGNPKLEKVKDFKFSNKNRDINEWQVLENLRESYKERLERDFPKNEYIIGRDIDRVQTLRISEKLEKAHPKKAEAMKAVNQEIKEFNKDIEAYEPQRKRQIVKEKNEQIKTVNKEAFHKREDTQISIYNSLCDWLVKERNKARDLLKEATKKVFNFAFKDIYGKTSFFERLEQKAESQIERTTIDNTYKAKPKIERLEGHLESQEQAKEYLSAQQYLKHYKACEGLEMDEKLKDAELSQERSIERHFGRF